MNVLELYSGIGGMHFALKGCGLAEVKLAIDINPVANEVYKFNFPETKNISRNIGSLSADELNKLEIQMILMSPPCQPFTRNGKFGDDTDPRTDSFLHIMDLFKSLKYLNYILIENVKGFENSETRDKLITKLSEAGFTYQEFILNPTQFGVPNSRLRYYLIAKKTLFDFETSETYHCSLPGLKSPELFELSEILEKDIDRSLYEINATSLLKYKKVIDLCHRRSKRSCCFTKGYGRYLEGTGSIFCENVENDKELEQYLNEGQLDVRYFTPKEISRLMSFPESFIFPPHITVKQRYRLLGNSLNVKVVQSLLLLLIK